jgi:endonuclease YncB( thermonuclease family)
VTRPKPLFARALAIALVPLTAAAAVALWPDAGEAQSARDEHAALFPVCRGPVRVTCVVDGDTIWYRGTKIRIADIDTPEVSQPACQRERALGRRATERLRQLLNAGRFGLVVPADGRTRDRYGRELRILTRGGQSLGAVLVREGLAERWGGPRKAWCRA